MIENRRFCHFYASLTNAQLPLLKVTALGFDKLVILDPVGASWATIGVWALCPRGRQAVVGRGHLADRDAGRQSGRGLKAIVSLSEADGEKIRREMYETYRLIETILNIVIIRLGDIQLNKGSFHIT